DQKALAWAIRALVLYLPAEEKAKPEPPKPPKKPARRLSPAQRRGYNGRTSWDRLPQRGWDGAQLPPRPPGDGSPTFSHVPEEVVSARDPLQDKGPNQPEAHEEQPDERP